jgi:hypothetical protein
MDSLILGLVVAFAVWFALRRARARRAQRQATSTPPPTGGQKTMPRIGTPGTVTKEQLRALRETDFEPSPHWSREEAQLILDAVAYLRGAIAITTGDRDPPIEIQNKVLSLILGEEELRTYMLDWSRNLTREERNDIQAAIPRDEQFERVQAYVRELWEDEAKA